MMLLAIAGSIVAGCSGEKAPEEGAKAPEAGAEKPAEGGEAK